MNCGRLSLFVCLLAAAVEAQYSYDHWTAETGLPQNIITDILQTPEGYLWVVTLDGLARFDGVRFTVFNKSNTPGLSSNRFTCLYRDSRGDLWAGTEVGALTRRHEGRFITYSNEHGLPNNSINGLIEDSHGRLLVFSGQKVREWNPAAGKFVERDDSSSYINSGILAWNRNEGYWAQDRDGLHLFKLGVSKFMSLPEKFIGSIEMAAATDDGSVWVSTADEQVVRLKDGEADFFSLRNRRLRAARPVTQWRDRTGKIWEFEIIHDLNRSLTMPASEQPETISLRVLYEDADGNLWLGTDGQGLYRIRQQIVTAYSREQGLIGRNVYPICETRDGSIWVGTWDGGLSQIKAGKIKSYTKREGLSDERVFALYEDGDGRLWISTALDLQILEQGRLKSVKSKYLPAQTTINAIYQDRTGAMWFGTNEGLFHHENGRTRRITLQDGLPGEIVRVIIGAAEGGVWVGCYGGLMRWRDGQITAWNAESGLPGNSVRSLYEDRDGALWIGAYDSGLGRFKDGKFTRYTTREGLFNDGVFQILEDAHGYFWMSCNRGIYRVRKQDLNEFAAGSRREVTSIAFGKSDGMRNVECNGGLWPAGVRSSDGRLWFPTQDGVAMIDPATVTTNQQPPPVLIETVLQDRAPIDWRDEVRLQPGQGNLEIQYTAICFANAAFSRFKYKLEGLDGDWVDAGTRRAAFFSYLPPGGYTFKVIAANSDGVWNTEGQSLRIAVLPPFYRTWWFLTLAALAVIGAALAAFKYRVAQLEQRQAAHQSFARQLIESQERERKRIAAELHDGLGQNLLIIKNYAMLGQIASEAEPQFREQFVRIADSASKSVEEVREIARNLRPYHLDRLGLTEALEDMIENVSASTAIRIVSEIEPIDDLFAKEAAITLYRVVQESLNNIIKHSQAGEARVSIERQSDSAIIAISDNGRGFAQQAAEAMHPGFGLAGMAERVRILGGELNIHSREGQGVTVTVRIKSTAKD